MCIRITLFSFFILAIFSCRSTYQYTQIQPKNIESVEDNFMYSLTTEDDLAIKTAYIGNGLDYSIFQIDIQNLSDKPIEMSHEDIMFDASSGPVVSSLNKYDFVKRLQVEKRNIKKEKKARTIGAILLGGLTLASIAIGGGSNAANTLNAATYAAESTAYIIDERRAFNATESTIEEEIKYIKDWVLFEEIIQPNEGLTRDVLFSQLNVDNGFDLVLQIEETAHRIPYSAVIKESSGRNH